MSNKNKSKVSGAELIDQYPPGESGVDTQTEPAKNVGDEQAQSKVSGVELIAVPLVTSQVIRSSYTEPVEDHRLVKVLVKYPEGYKGTRYMNNGQEYKVSRESAGQFVKQGIAEIVE